MVQYGEELSFKENGQLAEAPRLLQRPWVYFIFFPGRTNVHSQRLYDGSSSLTSHWPISCSYEWLTMLQITQEEPEQSCAAKLAPGISCTASCLCSRSSTADVACHWVSSSGRRGIEGLLVCTNEGSILSPALFFLNASTTPVLEGMPSLKVTKVKRFTLQIYQTTCHCIEPERLTIFSFRCHAQVLNCRCLMFQAMQQAMRCCSSALMYLPHRKRCHRQQCKFPRYPNSSANTDG